MNITLTLTEEEAGFLRQSLMAARAYWTNWQHDPEDPNEAELIAKLISQRDDLSRKITEAQHTARRSARIQWKDVA